MDNSSGQSPNSSHGSIIGCVFDHSGSNAGYGIKILGMEAGEIIQGCQFFFSKILIEDSVGIVLDGCNFGYGSSEYGALIEVTENLGENASLIISSCMFKLAPQITKTGSPTVHIVNSYLRDGTLITE